MIINKRLLLISGSEKAEKAAESQRFNDTLHLMKMNTSIYDEWINKNMVFLENS